MINAHENNNHTIQNYRKQYINHNSLKKTFISEILTIDNIPYIHFGNF